MIFFTVGSLFLVVGIIFKLFPSKQINRLYGYRSFRAEKDLETWKYAQKVSSTVILVMGAIGLGIGSLLRYMGWTQFFLLEMLSLVFLVIPIFAITETKLEKFEEQHKV